MALHSDQNRVSFGQYQHIEKRHTVLPFQVYFFAIEIALLRDAGMALYNKKNRRCRMAHGIFQWQNNVAWLQRQWQFVALCYLEPAFTNTKSFNPRYEACCSVFLYFIVVCNGMRRTRSTCKPKVFPCRYTARQHYTATILVGCGTLRNHGTARLYQQNTYRVQYYHL